jgi:WD40 repeat protein
MRFVFPVIGLILVLGLLPDGSSRTPAKQNQEFAVVVNGGTERSITLINSSTDAAIGPFLEGLLGSPGSELWDCLVTGDGHIAIVPNFLDSIVFFIDLTSEPPAILDSIGLSFQPRALALSRDSKYLLVSGGFRPTQVISIDMATRKIISSLSLNVDFFEALAIAPNGAVLGADFNPSLVRILSLDAEGKVSDIDRSIMVDGRPSSLAISPDGRTVIVCNRILSVGSSSSDTVTILRIDSPTGIIKTGTIRGLPGTQTNAAFSPDGKKVLVLSLDPRPDEFSILNVIGPGMVRNSGQRIDLLTNTNGFGGLHEIAFTSDGSKVYMGNPSIEGGVASRVAVIDMTLSPPTIIKTIPVPIPVGIAFPGR